LLRFLRIIIKTNEN